MSSDAVVQALKEGLEGVARSLERLRDDLHKLEVQCTRDDAEVRAQISNVRAMLGHRLDDLEAAGKAVTNVQVAKVGAKAKISAQLIITVGTVLTAVGALLVALLK